jgi:hypothetical protein
MVQAPIPGVRPEDVEVSFADGVLTINATRREDREQREGRFLLRREIAFGNYQRRIALPGDVQADNITARFDNGVLTIEVPRSARPEPPRIEVQPGERSRQESADASGDSSAGGSDQASGDVSSQGSGAAKSEGSGDASGQADETSGKEAETSASTR